MSRRAGSGVKQIEVPRLWFGAGGTNRRACSSPAEGGAGIDAGAAVFQPLKFYLEDGNRKPNFECEDFKI